MAQPLVLIAACSWFWQFSQIITPTPPVASSNSALDAVQIAEHLTLTGALIVAVIILWKALSAKDLLITKSIEEQTKALSATAASNEELRKIIQDSLASKEQLGDVIREIHASTIQRQKD